MHIHNNFKSRIHLFTINIIILFAISGCTLPPPLCSDLDVIYPAVTSSQAWWKADYIWQDDTHIIYVDATGQFNKVSLNGTAHELNYIDSYYDYPYTFFVGWSSEHSLLGLMDRNQSLKIVDLENEQEQSLPVRDTIYNITWSPVDPDIAIITTEEGNFLIFADVNKTNDEVLDGAMHPVWSPDGKKIAYLRDVPIKPGNYTQLHVSLPDSKKSIYTVSEGACQWNYSWSPDSQKFTFDSRHEGDADIYVATVDGKNQSSINLTNTKTVHEYQPHWSPKGNEIVFIGVTAVTNSDGTLRSARHADGERVRYPDIYTNLFDVRHDIYSANLDTGKVTRLTDSDPDVYEIYPIWSPDGEHIAFMSYNYGIWSLEVMNADGTGRNVLASWDDKFYGNQ